ncbi:MAG: amidohydrolase family protein [Chloroflexota bacterium]
MIIDAHVHLWDRLHGEDAGVDRQALTWGRAREGDRIYYCAPPSFEDSRSTYERAIAHMDCLGVDRMVVLQEFMDGKQDDYLAKVRHVEPTRFSCVALFTREYLDDPMGCFKHAIDEQKLQGFLVITPSRFPEVATLKLEPLWRACAERGLPVVVKNGDPAEIRSLIKMAPGLKLVLSHFAGAWGDQGEYAERLKIVAGSENVFIDAGALTYRLRAPFTKAQERLHAAVEAVGAAKIAWGSDYPRPGLIWDASYKQQLEFVTVECDFLSDADRAQILGGTALKVYLWG